MPKDKAVEARHQTQHKLETMDRYWRIWCRILAQANRFPFCARHLWLVDTMAGAGLHESEGDRDGVVAGTPFQAVRAARATQTEFMGTTIHVRAIDKNRQFTVALERIVTPYRGAPPRQVDVRVDHADWVDAVDAIKGEISSSDHSNPSGLRDHQHRSLWLIDPYGVEPLDRAIIEQLPPHAEVIVNFDENSMRRHAGKRLAFLAEKIYGDDQWQAGVGEPAGTFARIFAETFPRYTFRNVYPLRPSGNQDRFFVHLTTAKAAVGAFERAHKAALKAGTLIAGELLTGPQKHDAAVSLMERFAGQSLTINEMRASGAGYGIVQLRAICQAADELGYVTWDAGKDTARWFMERAGQPTLGL